MRYRFVMTWLATSLLIGGCMNYDVIPEPLDKEINRSVTFADLKRDPEIHKGKTVVLGGIVLRAKHLKDGTQIEVLQIPLDRADRPDNPMEASQGRFLILDPEHHDPAVLKDRRITVVGEVTGKTVDKIDEFEYTFPYVSARLIYIWPERRGYAYSPPYYYPYPYYYYPDPFFYGYPPWYYGPPLITPLPGPPPHRRFQAPSERESPPPQSPEGPSNRRFENKAP